MYILPQHTHIHLLLYSFCGPEVYTCFNQVYRLRSLTKLQTRGQPGLESHLKN